LTLVGFEPLATVKTLKVNQAGVAVKSVDVLR
jgi:hypothetical protein